MSLDRIKFFLKVNKLISSEQLLAILINIAKGGRHTPEGLFESTENGIHILLNSLLPQLNT